MFTSPKYQELRATQGRVVAQTLDSPVMVLDIWQIGDIYAVLGVLLVFGLLLKKWLITMILIGFIMGLIPTIRRNNEKGFLFHLPYKKLGVPLRGLPNPQMRTKYSD